MATKKRVKKAIKKQLKSKETAWKSHKGKTEKNRQKKNSKACCKKKKARCGPLTTGKGKKAVPVKARKLVASRLRPVKGKQSPEEKKKRLESF